KTFARHRLHGLQQTFIVDTLLAELRSLIERFFCRIKQLRRVATCYDKRSESFESFVARTAAFIWLYELSTDPRTERRDIPPIYRCGR
ncbi:hypothetical protein CE195_00200, partial [Sodalis-like symbiont of Philaenus spumarius]